MKRFFFILLFIPVIMISCAMQSKYIDDAPRDRLLIIGNTKVSENQYGGVERWYAIDKYGNEKNKVRFQLGYFKDNQVGFILYEGGTKGDWATYYRQGLELRWDWGNYSIIIKPDGTGLYYDFSYRTTDVSPKARFQMRKF